MLAAAELVLHLLIAPTGRERKKTLGAADMAYVLCEVWLKKLPALFLINTWSKSKHYVCNKWAVFFGGFYKLLDEGGKHQKCCLCRDCYSQIRLDVFKAEEAQSQSSHAIPPKTICAAAGQKCIIWDKTRSPEQSWRQTKPSGYVADISTKTNMSPLSEAFLTR